jgi:hypothetical protein
MGLASGLALGTGAWADTLPLNPEIVPSPTETAPPVSPTQRQPCPPDLAPLVAQLLHDLPTYANLVASRSLGHPAQRPSPFGTVLLASQPEFTPLALGTDEPSPDLHQVFFTTLERQYWQQQSVSLQHYHWLFLTPSQEGWRLALLYSSLGAYPAGGRGASPPQESSQGLIGQAITLWLRDCRAGSVAFPVPEVPTPRGL